MGNISRFQAPKITFLRALTGKTRRDQRMKELERNSRSECLADILEKKRLQWIGHVKQIYKGKVSRRAILTTGKVRRPRGRLKQRCYDMLHLFMPC